MAKLSARGRVSVVEAFKMGMPDGECSERKTEKRLMSDGVLLEKHTVVFFDGNRRHTWGWKKLGKLNSNKTPEMYARWLEDRGWTVTKRPEEEEDANIPEDFGTHQYHDIG